LIGLPPTPEELDAFLRDESPDSWERVVDRLLNDPRYGERWARHWMDVWRYADWYGRRSVPDVWNSAPQIWRWRDWIVKSLNEDKGYDRMVQEMLAADEICPEDDDAAVATGYLIRNWYALNPNDWMRNTVEHTGKAFLGLTFNCAHCHDHKYDPITQDDYFRLRAFFEPMDVRQDQVPGEADPGPFQQYEYVVQRKVQRLGMVRIYDRRPDAPTWFYSGGDERNRLADRGSMAPGVPAFLSSAFEAVEPVEHPPQFRHPALRSAMIAARRRELQTVIDTATAAVASLTEPDAEAIAATTEQVRVAEEAWLSAVMAARAKGQPGALSGSRSLVLDASTGRRMIHRSLAELTELPDATTLHALIRIEKDTHFNLQLAKGLAEGATATVVGFEGGRIFSYQPGSFMELDAGRYDFAAGQREFAISLTLDRTNDVCRLTVQTAVDGTRLVDEIPVALNGWNPCGNQNQGLLMDARTGSVTIVDDIQLIAPASGTATVPRALYAATFEEAHWLDDTDAVGVDGWARSSYSVAPAMSLVSSSALNAGLREAADRLRAARAAHELPSLRRQAAAARLTAATLQRDEYEWQIADARQTLGLSEAERREPSGEGTTSRSEIATGRLAPLRCKSEESAKGRQPSAAELSAAARSTAVADELSARVALSEALALSATDESRAKAIETATTALDAARSALAATEQPPASTTNPLLAGLEVPARSTGRRRALANWITNDRQPLTARVAVNHIWMRHFHQPLVDTVFDFGRNGAAPTHPELLDWLACELRDHDWSMKHLHRLIVTSEAWRRASSVPVSRHSRAGGNPGLLQVVAQNTARDPDNRLLWRMNAGRMEAEVVRDSVLAVAGKLDLTMGGQELENSEALTTFRRSLYYCSQPEGDGRSAFGVLFDAPDALDCYRRTESIIPQQALALTNSDFVHSMVTAVVDRLREPERENASRGEREFVEQSFVMVLSRPPSEAEAEACMKFLHRDGAAESVSTDGDTQRLARESLVRALLNHNDFVGIR
jgi:hypothetical protein